MLIIYANGYVLVHIVERFHRASSKVQAIEGKASEVDAIQKKNSSSKKQRAKRIETGKTETFEDSMSDMDSSVMGLNRTPVDFKNRVKNSRRNKGNAKLEKINRDRKNNFEDTFKSSRSTRRKQLSRRGPSNAGGGKSKSKSKNSVKNTTSKITPISRKKSQKSSKLKNQVD